MVNNTFGYPYNLEANKDVSREWVRANHTMYKSLSDPNEPNYDPNDPVQILLEIVLRVRVALLGYEESDSGHTFWLFKLWNDLIRNSTPEAWTRHRHLRSSFSGMFKYFNAFKITNGVDLYNKSIGHMLIDTVFPNVSKVFARDNDTILHITSECKRTSKYIVCAELQSCGVHDFAWLGSNTDTKYGSSEYPEFTSRKNLDFHSMTSWDDMFYPADLYIDDDLTF